MKIGIHPRKNSFTDRFIEYFDENHIPFDIIDLYASDAIEKCKPYDVILWHWSHEDPIAYQMALNLTKSLELMDVIIYPNINTSWYFDNKITQKYIFEALEIPHVPSHVFYSLRHALDGTRSFELPLVFKLKGGAGSINVKLLKNKSALKWNIYKMFYWGYGSSNRFSLLQNRIWRFKRDKNLESFMNVFKGIARLFVASDLERLVPKQKGYFYVQDFVANNNCDFRVIVVNNKAIAIKRYVREKDFRASGSGLIEFLGDGDINPKCIDISFCLAEKLNSQSLAVDFVIDSDKNPLVVEISHGFVYQVYDNCPGYWLNDDLEFIPRKINLQNEILKSILENV